jgi:hypothetical protein
VAAESEVKNFVLLTKLGTFPKTDPPILVSRLPSCFSRKWEKMYCYQNCRVDLNIITALDLEMSPCPWNWFGVSFLAAVFGRHRRWLQHHLWRTFQINLQQSAPIAQ